MLAVPGLRPEKVLRLYKDLGVTSLAALEAAAKEDRIISGRRCCMRQGRRSIWTSSGPSRSGRV
jgi:hypothetical protein